MPDTKQFKVIIAGTHTFNDYNMLCQYADFKLSKITDPIEIVSGGARGADALGERYARDRGYALIRFPADWETYGICAGFIRNVTMAMYADALLAFWDGRSRGTKHMIDEALKAGLKVGVKRY